MFSYILHYYTVDRSEGLAPSELWFNYRFGMAAIAGLALLFYSVPRLYNIRGYKIPVMLACAFFTYFQAQTILWYNQVPYLYVFAFIFISTLMIRATVLTSLIYAAALTAMTFETMLQSGQSSAMISSASAVTFMFILFYKSKYNSELNLFIATQKNFEQQKKFIEVNVEFTDQIKAFLPAEISKRLTYYVQESRMSILQAIDEVLRPRNLNVACLWTDIRGFTKGSNDLSGYVSKAMFPNVKISTELVEKYNGIPRKVGDLIFAYYDLRDHQQNVLHATLSATAISQFNAEMNSQLPPEQRINRYILLSCGDAVVGNLSSYESAIEITAIGRPVNILSRIDELTKNETLKSKIEHGDIIMTTEVARQLKEVLPDLQLKALDLSLLSLKIRDFEEISQIYILKPTKTNLDALLGSSGHSDFIKGAA